VKLPKIANQANSYWNSEVVEAWESLTSQASQLDRDASRAFVGSVYFRKLQTALDSQGIDGVWSLLVESPRYLDALAILWRSGRKEQEDRGLAARDWFEETQQLAYALNELTYQVRELTLRNLHATYLERFDGFAQEPVDLRECLRHWLEASFARLADTQPLLRTFVEEVGPYFLAPGHLGTLVNTAKHHIDGVSGWASEGGLTGYLIGRYQAVVEMEFFRQLVHDADPISGRNTWLSELHALPVLTMTNSRGELFGQEALSLMVQRPKRTPQDEWVQAILQWVGDPRTRQRDDLWQSVSPADIAVFISWLAASDLQAFLDVTERYAQNDVDMSRMFVERKKFIEGLNAQGLIRSTRLFLGKTALHELEPTLVRRGIRRYVAAITGGYSTTAVIYMELKGEFGSVHAIEGSHSWKMRVFQELPSDDLLNSAKRDFTFNDLGPELARKYDIRQSKLGASERCFERAHSGDVWMADVAANLKRRGVKFNANALLSPRAFHHYQSVL